MGRHVEHRPEPYRAEPGDHAASTPEHRGPSRTSLFVDRILDACVGRSAPRRSGISGPSSMTGLIPEQRTGPISVQAARDVLNGGGQVIAAGDEPVGYALEFLLDDRTGQPTWVTTRPRWRALAVSYVPLPECVVDGADLRVPFTRSSIRRAPRPVTAGRHLLAQDALALLRHYGLMGDGGGASPSNGRTRTGATVPGDDGA